MSLYVDSSDHITLPQSSSFQPLNLFANLSLCLRIRSVVKDFLACFLAGNAKSHWMRLRMVLTETFWKYSGYLTFSSDAVKKGSRASCILRNLSVLLVILRGLPVTFLLRGTSPTGRSRARCNSRLTVDSDLPNFLLNSWIVSSWSLPSIILAYSITVSCPLPIVEAYFFILKVFCWRRQGREISRVNIPADENNCTPSASVNNNTDFRACAVRQQPTPAWPRLSSKRSNALTKPQEPVT